MRENAGSGPTERGPAACDRPGRGRRAQARWIGRGFTLIETMVVLLILGIFVGLVGTIAGPNDRGMLRLEAERLAQLLDLAAEESRLAGRPIAWTAETGEYRFFRFLENDWSEIRDRDLFRARRLPAGMTISALRVENMRPPGAMRIQFTPYSPVLSFSVEISLGNERYAVVASPIGDVKVLPAEGMTNGGMVSR